MSIIEDGAPVPAKKIRAPWTEDQVVALNAYQANGAYHPYTCCGAHGILIATVDGWRCMHCDYKQDWALEASAEIADRKPKMFGAKP